jgi:hypothetical protein
MGKHSKDVDYNNTPYDPKASPEKKAEEFDKQYGQNRQYSDHPALDRYEGKRK